MNIDVNRSEFSYTEDYDVWTSVVDSLRPNLLKSYKLKFLTAPTSSYYDKFLIAKSRKGTLEEFEKILNNNSGDVVLFNIEEFKYADAAPTGLWATAEPHEIKIGYAFRYALISEAK